MDCLLNGLQQINSVFPSIRCKTHAHTYTHLQTHSLTHRNTHTRTRTCTQTHRHTRYSVYSVLECTLALKPGGKQFEAFLLQRPHPVRVKMSIVMAQSLSHQCHRVCVCVSVCVHVLCVCVCVHMFACVCFCVCVCVLLRSLKTVTSSEFPNPLNTFKLSLS